MAVVVKGVDYGRVRFLRSQEYAAMTPKEREALLTAYDSSSPEQREQFVAKLTPVNKATAQDALSKVSEAFTNPSQEALKGAAATGIDILGGGGGALLGGWKGGRGGALVGEVAGSVLADRVNRGLGLRDTKTVDTPIPGISVENKQILGPVTTGDLIAGGTPLLARGVGALAKAATKPGQMAIRTADETNTRNQQEYTNKVETTSDEIWGRINREYERVDQKDAASLEAFQAWQNRGQLMKDEFLARRQKILDDATLTNDQRKTTLQQEIQAYHNRIAEHQAARANLPDAGVTSPGPIPQQQQMFEQVGGHEPVYNRAQQAARQASDVDLTNFHGVAGDLNVALTQPADPLQNPFRRVTDALSNFGEATGGQVPLERVIETQKKLGQVIGRSSGETRGVARRLYSELQDTLEAHAANDPRAAEALTAQREASRRFMRDQNAQEWANLWKANAREVQPGVWEVNDQGLRDGFNKLKEDRFFQMGWTPEEQAHMQQTIYQTPQEKIGKAPTMEPADPSQQLRNLDFEYEQQTTKHMADQPPTPTTSQPELDKLDYPAYPDGPPKTVSPSLEFDNFGPAITTKIAVGELAGRMMGLGGPAPGVGLAAASAVFGLPYAVSKGLLALPGGEQVLRNIMAGKQRVTPEFLSGITGYLRAKGMEIRENEDE